MIRHRSRATAGRGPASRFRSWLNDRLLNRMNTVSQSRFAENWTASRTIWLWLIAYMTLAAVYFAWPLWRAFLPLQIVYSDAWNTYHADDVRLGRPLYAGPESLVVSNYPPLSFHLVGSLSAVTGLDAMLVGRLLSLLAVLAIAAAIHFVVRQLGGSRIGGLLGALCFVATTARFYDLFVGINDPHLVALAIMMWALVWFLRRHREGRAVEPAILLMVVGGFYKHTLVSAPMAALAFLAFSDLRRALRAALVGGAAAALGLALCSVIYGPAFLQSIFMQREYSLMRPLSQLGRLQWIAPPLIIFGVWAWYQRRGEGVRFAGLFVIMAFTGQFLQLAGAGVVDNVHLELIAAGAVGVGVAFSAVEAVPLAQRWGADRTRSAIVVVLLARLVLSARMTPYLLFFSPDFHAQLVQRVAIANSETARIAMLQGPVACSVMMVCRRAGKPFLFDDFYVAQLMATGRVSSSVIDQRIRALGLRFETIDPLADLDRIRPP